MNLKQQTLSQGMRTRHWSQSLNAASIEARDPQSESEVRLSERSFAAPHSWGWNVRCAVAAPHVPTRGTDITLTHLRLIQRQFVDPPLGLSRRESKRMRHGEARVRASLRILAGTIRGSHAQLSESRSEADPNPVNTHGNPRWHKEEL